MMQIENYETLVGQGNRIGVFTIYDPNKKIRIHQCKVVAKKQGGYFFSMPQFVREIDGVKKYYPLFEYNKEEGAEVVRLVYEALKEFVR